MIFALVVSIIGLFIDIFILQKEKKLTQVNHSKRVNGDGSKMRFFY